MRRRIDINEAARISGMSVSWWRQKVFRKEMPFYKIGRRIVFDAEEIGKILDRWPCGAGPGRSSMRGRPQSNCTLPWEVRVSENAG